MASERSKRRDFLSLSFITKSISTKLLIKYCPSRKCQHPLHGRRKGKVSRGVNLKMSKEIKETWAVLVPVGSGKRDH